MAASLAAALGLEAAVAVDTTLRIRYPDRSQKAYGCRHTRCWEQFFAKAAQGGPMNDGQFAHRMDARRCIAPTTHRGRDAGFNSDFGATIVEPSRKASAATYVGLW